MNSESADSAGADHEAEIDRLVADYIDRYNLGESLSPEIILAEHPRLAPEILAQLEAFLDIEGAGGNPGLLREVGDFQLVRRLGSGGMGVVYEAWEESLDRRVALKLLPAGAAADGTTLRRFLREARAAGRLNHRNIVAVHAMGLAAGTPYYSMEYVNGETLAALRTRLGLLDGAPVSEEATRQALIELISVLPKADASGAKSTEQLSTASVPALRARYARTVAHTFAEVARGLQHAHEGGVVHRDIKPSNLILDREPGPAQPGLRILDFGLARLTGDESLTVDGAFLGTPLYMSPEQVRSGQGQEVEVDRSTDVYSLGLCLYEMLAWRHPFGPGIGPQIYRETLEREPPSLAPLVHRDLDAIVSKCLRKAPHERYATAEALAQDLDRFVRSEPVEAKPLGPWRRGARRIWAARRRVAWTTTVLALAGAVVALVLVGLSSRVGMGRRKIWDTEGVVFPRVTPAGDRMVYIDYSGGDVIVHDFETDVATNLTAELPDRDKEAFPEHALIAPDGSAVIYSWCRRDRKSEVRRVELDRPDQHEAFLSLEDVVHLAGWSQDGRKVLVTCGRGEAPERFTIIRSDSGELIDDWPAPIDLRMPRLSPDGRWIVFKRPEPGDTSRHDVFVLDTDSGVEAPLLTEATDDHALGVTPDGRTLLLRRDAGGVLGLWKAPFDGASGRLSGEPAFVVAWNDSFWPAGFRGDGAYFASETLGEYQVFLGILDAHGAIIENRPISARPARRRSEPAFSPNGRFVACQESLTTSSWKDASGVHLLRVDFDTNEERRFWLPPFQPGTPARGPLWVDESTCLLIGTPLGGEPTLLRIDFTTGETTKICAWNVPGLLLWSGLDYREGAIVQIAGAGNGTAIRRVDPETCEVVDEVVFDVVLRKAVISPNGSQVAYLTPEDLVAVRSLDDPSAPPRVLDWPWLAEKPPVRGSLRWSPDGRELRVIDFLDGEWRALELESRRDRRIGKPERVSGRGVNAWSPLDTHVAYEAKWGTTSLWVLEGWQGD